MIRKVHKWFWIWQFEDEEKWLNEMSAKGLHLVSISVGTYLFEEGDPGKYSYRLEFLENHPSHPLSIQYIKFLEEANVKYMGNIFRWAYFRIKTDEGTATLFSDIDSKIKHLKRVSYFIIPLMLLQISGIKNIHIYFSTGFKSDLIIGILSLLIALWIGYGYLRIRSKINKLQKERILHE